MSDMALIMYFFKRASPTADADMIGLGEEEIGVLGGWVFSGVTSRFLWLAGFKYPASMVFGSFSMIEMEPKFKGGGRISVTLPIGLSFFGLF